MKDGRINLRVDGGLARQIKKYAEKNGTTVSAIVDKHFRELLELDKRARAVVPTHDAEQV